MNDESPMREVGSQIRDIVSNCGSVEGSVQEERSQYGRLLERDGFTPSHCRESRRKRR